MRGASDAAAPALLRTCRAEPVPGESLLHPQHRTEEPAGNRPGDVLPCITRFLPQSGAATAQGSECWSGEALQRLRLPCLESADGLENKFDFKSHGFKEELLIEVTFLKSWSKYCPLLSTEILLSGCCDPNKLCSRDGRAQCELFYFVVQMHPGLSV